VARADAVPGQPWADLLERAVAAAREGAALAARLRIDGVGDVASKSTHTDPVTAADRAVEALVVRLLRDGHPNDRVLGEEGGELAIADPAVGDPAVAGSAVAGSAVSGSGAADRAVSPRVRY
jgi:3'-phosphoadenosine 5'-phosphosulfate (PAPS) 3'-phosphatase